MIGSRDLKKARTFAEQVGCSKYGTYEDVLADPEVDAVYISLPNSMHEEWVVKAAANGKHIWCDKPAALTYESAQKMVGAAQANSVRLMEGFMFLYHPQQARVKTLIEEGAIGDIVSFDGTFSFPKPEAGNIRLNKILGGGSYYDAGVYPIRASRFIFGEEPERVTCKLEIDHALGVDVASDATLTYSGNRVAHVRSAFSDDYQSTYTVMGTRGSIRMERAYAVPKDMPVKIFLDRNGTLQEISIEPAAQFTLMIDAFCDELTRGEETRNFEADLLLQSRVVEAGVRSHVEGRTINTVEIG
jgi:predicted dehydrogenase